MTTLDLTAGDRVERALATTTLALLVAAVALVWPVAEATRFLLERLLCPRR